LKCLASSFVRVVLPEPMFPANAICIELFFYFERLK
jgi:hypothetical protein